MRTSINLEIGNGAKFLTLTVTLFVFVGCFLYGFCRSIQVLTDFSVPASELVLPISLFVIGFVGTFVSWHFMDMLEKDLND